MAEEQPTLRPAQNVHYLRPLNVFSMYFSLAESAGPDGHSAGSRQSHPTRHHRAGQPGGGADLPAAMENPQRLRPAERPGPARFPTAGRLQ